MAVKVVTDSTSYLPASIREDYDISVVSLSISFDTESYLEDEIENSFFYQRMDQSKTFPVSSQPSIRNLYNAFEKAVAIGDAVLGIFLSSEMSGTYATALTAKNMVLEEHPEAVIEIVDSRSNCMQLGFAVLAGAKAARSGDLLQQAVASVHRVINSSRFLFIPQTLDYLKKGGRIGGAAHLLGSLLKIKPILTVMDGKTTLLNKIRTSEKAIQEILTLFYQDIQKKGLAEVAVHHINDEMGGKKIAQMIGEKLGIQVPVYPIGPVIGAHVGPGALGIVYCTREEL